MLAKVNQQNDHSDKLSKRRVFLLLEELGGHETRLESLKLAMAAQDLGSFPTISLQAPEFTTFPSCGRHNTIITTDNDSDQCPHLSTSNYSVKPHVIV